MLNPDTGLPEDPSSFWKLVNLDPTMLHMVVTFITGIAALFGLTLTNEKATAIAVLILMAVAMGMQVWVRRRTISMKKVLAYVPDPTQPTYAVYPGPATTDASDKAVINAVRFPGPK